VTNKDVIEKGEEGTEKEEESERQEKLNSTVRERREESLPVFCKLSVE
jgi:hypothetical protein